MKHDAKSVPRRKSRPAGYPLSPDTPIYRTTCPYCGADIYYTLEMKHEKKLICLSCLKDVPNPHYDPSDPRCLRRALRTGISVFICVAACIVAAWLVWRYALPV
ncbi:MAG TPA: hypothetical protein DDZ96_06260 [Porphyromonadaceae bacterium]|uniref:hypothetical protein n=1 Tax=Limibacterium fermenti TaxID=3229863 RepID=UPI000E97E2B6|nr:hypothetical protein [Porphyromonadaceae bacterium]HBK31173.1 hypothetical protein [Porphyromonadaceae bacterium]HBL33410.1 hypothetical protein [Porphyromonadaceae bacterium]HBX45188.1 hypothetical protein [Porphyromonadaceae bacterium]HCM19379.1 hypothetical protein [Porphyromonadaceae bacterium]